MIKCACGEYQVGGTMWRGAWLEPHPFGKFIIGECALCGRKFKLSMDRTIIEPLKKERKK